jgi:hypothetical protein
MKITDFIKQGEPGANGEVGPSGAPGLCEALFYHSVVII